MEVRFGFIFHNIDAFGFTLMVERIILYDHRHYKIEFDNINKFNYKYKNDAT